MCAVARVKLQRARPFGKGATIKEIRKENGWI